MYSALDWSLLREKSRFYINFCRIGSGLLIHKNSLRKICRQRPSHKLLIILKTKPHHRRIAQKKLLCKNTAYLKNSSIFFQYLCSLFFSLLSLTTYSNITKDRCCFLQKLVWLHFVWNAIECRVVYSSKIKNLRMFLKYNIFLPCKRR